MSFLMLRQLHLIFLRPTALERKEIRARIASEAASKGSA